MFRISFTFTFEAHKETEDEHRCAANTASSKAERYKATHKPPLFPDLAGTRLSLTL
jgi:hypothetical protein